MNWANKAKDWGPDTLLFLSTDGASVNFIVVADPELLQGTYKNKANKRVACPVVTSEGFKLFITGLRTARKLASIEAKFATHVINVTRHGAEGDTDATCEVSALEDAAAMKKLLAVKAKTFTAESLAAALKDAKEVIAR